MSNSNSNKAIDLFIRKGKQAAKQDYRPEQWGGCHLVQPAFIMVFLPQIFQLDQVHLSTEGCDTYLANMAWGIKAAIATFVGGESAYVAVLVGAERKIFSKGQMLRAW